MPEDDFFTFTGRLRLLDGSLQQEVVIDVSDDDPSTPGMDDHQRREWRDVPTASALDEPASG